MISTIAACITAVGVLIAVWGLRASQRQRLRQFETLYVERYWALMDRLSLKALRGDAASTIEPGDEKAVRAYLRLCEDQLELRKAGWISDATWAIWSEGMRYQLERWPFDAIWLPIAASAGNDFELLKAAVRNSDYEPCRLRWWRRRLAGLGGPTSI